MRIEGCIPPMVTPVTDEPGEVKEDVLRSYTEFLVENDVHGLFPCGSTGEFSSFTRQQRQTIVETVVATADGTPVLAGCGDTSIDRVTACIDDAAAAGADAAVVVTPYYLETTQQSLEEFFTRVADRAALPVVLYDIPSLTGRSLNVNTVADLAAHENIVGLKVSIGDSLHFYELSNATPDSFALLPGYPEMTVPSLDIGGDGVVAGPANVFPAAVADIYDTYVAGDRSLAVERMNEVVMPILSTIRSMPTVPALKYLLSLRGFDVGPPHSPMPTLTEAQRETLDGLYDEIQIAAPIEHDY